MKDLKTKLNQLRRSDGFTIIEVMIVLAIAGVIMLIVLLTVPALQRNSRNTQRRSDATHIVALINEYATNNNGSLPTALCLSGACAATAVNLTSDHFALLTFNGATNTGSVNLNAWTADPTFTAANGDQAKVYTSVTCLNNAGQAGGGARSFAVFYAAESPGVAAGVKQCVGS